jgi:hypothetical protein
MASILHSQQLLVPFRTLFLGGSPCSLDGLADIWKDESEYEDMFSLALLISELRD